VALYDTDSEKFNSNVNRFTLSNDTPLLKFITLDKLKRLLKNKWDRDKEKYKTNINSILNNEYEVHWFEYCDTIGYTKHLSGCADHTTLLGLKPQDNEDWFGSEEDYCKAMASSFEKQENIDLS
jgi:hypothetical protein